MTAMVTTHTHAKVKDHLFEKLRAEEDRQTYGTQVSVAVRHVCKLLYFIYYTLHSTACCIRDTR